MVKWTKEEVLILKQKFSSSTKNEICSVMPNKTYLAIYKKARSLGIKLCEDTKFKNRSIGSKREKVAEYQKNSKGYVLIHNPTHKRADKYGRVFEHIIVWENYHNKEVPNGYIIHHINGIKDDNRPENLKLLTASEYTILHNSSRKLSEETKRKISEKAKERYGLGTKPPMYKKIDLISVVEDLSKGLKFIEICKKYNIGRSTLYKKLKQEGYYESRISYRQSMC